MAEVLRAVVLATLLSPLACATVKVPQPTGGSRADGTVQLAYEYGELETPEVDWESANRAATERCQNWGYASAEAFGPGVTQCTASNQYGCTRYFVTITYQCIPGSQQ